MTKTQAEVADDVGRTLGLINEGAPALTGYQDQRIDQWIDAIHLELEDAEIAYWEKSAVPDVVSMTLAEYIASRCAHEFLSGQNLADKKALEGPSMRRLEKLTSRHWTGAPNSADRF
jgi:hypothetical protein